MPQMAPLNWLSLLLFFIMIFMLTNSLNFYSFIYQVKTLSPKQSHKIKLTWKWL
uniref:ATP synthase F0 subunit 8 n=1 Tax=Meloe mediterraneus TaxID=2781717 RepID=UPI001EDF00A9|nr:ATP synthase F0 subunit 8 [Meloe mediterraneus]UKE80239.1 ATP synthase F0 subunit 8 [Meloe mediterraneus]